MLNNAAFEASISGDFHAVIGQIFDQQPCDKIRWLDGLRKVG
jgi:hypothetical protein